MTMTMMMMMASPSSAEYLEFESHPSYFRFHSSRDTGDPVATPLACRCGAVRGTLDHVGSVGNHVVCYCIDCQTYAHHLERADVLDDHGGSAVYQSRPSAMQITQGRDQVRCLRLSPKGTLRFYAGCCNTPMANMAANPRAPFVGVPLTFFAEPDSAPPVRVRVMGKYAHGSPDGAHASAPADFILQAGARLAVDLLRGHHRPSPFDGEPAIERTVLTLEERQASKDRAAAPPR